MREFNFGFFVGFSERFTRDFSKFEVDCKIICNDDSKVFTVRGTKLLNFYGSQLHDNKRALRA